MVHNSQQTCFKNQSIDFSKCAIVSLHVGHKEGEILWTIDVQAISHVVLFKSHNNLVRSLWSPFYTWGSCGSRWSGLLKITSLVDKRTGITFMSDSKICALTLPCWGLSQSQREDITSKRLNTTQKQKNKMIKTTLQEILLGCKDMSICWWINQGAMVLVNSGAIVNWEKETRDLDLDDTASVEKERGTFLTKVRA